MLNLPSPQAVLPLDLAVPAEPPEMPPVAGQPLPAFAGLVAASAGALPIAAGPVDTVSGEAEATESPAIEQAWALVLVPELANLPAEFVPPPALPAALANAAESLVGAAAGDAAGRLAVGDGVWRPRAAVGPRLGALPAGDRARPRDWQVGLPSVPSPPTPPPAEFILRNVTGQPIPFPTADQPPWYDPAQAPPWFDPANPPPPWSDPTRPPPLWYDPTRLPPAWLDPARVPAAWFDVPRPPAMAIGAVAEVRPDPLPAPAGLPPVAGPAPAVVPPQAAAALPPPLQGERPRRAGFDEQPALAERPAPTLPAFTLAAPPPSLAAPATAQASAAALPNLSPAAAETNPALTVFSDRLGDVAVRLSGGPDQLQVVMQAQPAAAALIGADAPRLSQDLAAAGVALAGLSVNGQRADLGGGGRDRQRQSSRRDDGSPIAATRRLAARAVQNPLGLNRPATIDRFA